MSSTSNLGSAPEESTKIRGLRGEELSSTPLKSKYGVSINDLSMLSTIRFCMEGNSFSGLRILIIISFWKVLIFSIQETGHDSFR